MPCAIPCLRSVETKENEDPLISRGSALVLSTIVVGLSAVVITFGTSAPLLTSWFMEQPGQVGPEFYNTVNLPLALLIALFLAAVPFLTWKGMDASGLLRKLRPSVILAAIITVDHDECRVRSRGLRQYASNARLRVVLVRIRR